MKKFMFKLFSFALAAAFLIGAVQLSPVHAYASEIDEDEFEQMVEETKSLFENSREYTVEDLMSFPDQPEIGPLDTSAFYDALAHMDMGVFSTLKYDVENANINNVNALNMQYLSMLSDMSAAGYGTTAELEIPELSAGYSADITEMFKSAFGDLSGKYVDNTEAFMDAATTKIALETSIKETQTQRDAGDIKSTDLYQTVVGNISAGNIVVSAQATLETPELKTPLELNSLLSENASAMGAEWEEKQQKALLEIQSVATDNSAALADLSAKNAEELQELFEQSKNTTNSWVDKNTNSDGSGTDMFNGISNVFGSSASTLVSAFLGDGIIADKIEGAFGEAIDHAELLQSMGGYDALYSVLHDPDYRVEPITPPQIGDTNQEQPSGAPYAKTAPDGAEALRAYSDWLQEVYGPDVPSWNGSEILAEYYEKVVAIVGDCPTFAEYMLEQWNVTVPGI